MRRQLFCRFDVSWPEGRDRRTVIDSIVERQIACWTKPLPDWVQSEPVGRWLSERVLELRIAVVTVWVVITEREVSLFWNAPATAKVFLNDSRRNTIIEALRHDVADALDRLVSHVPGQG